MRRALATASLVLLVLVAAPAGAFGQGVLQDFKNDGAINPCKYSDGQLRQGINNVPPDIDQYAPGFADQLRSGRGNCGGGGGSSSQQGNAGGDAAGGGAAGGGPGGGRGGRGGPNSSGSERGIAEPPAPPVPPKTKLAGAGAPRIAAEPSGSNAPSWLFFLAAIALMAGAVATVARRRGWSAERFTRPLGAAFDEAGGRTADALATTRERLHLGRG